MAKFIHRMKAYYKKHILDFKIPSGTSRGILTKKETWFLIITNENQYGIGECGLLKGLSHDDIDTYEDKLHWVIENIALGELELLKATSEFPSIQFGIEQAFQSLKSKNQFILYDSDFTNKNAPISINGLVWMGNREFMFKQIKEKIEAGFSCIKMKIGAIDFNTELELLTYIRKHFSVNEIELRVDANGAFEPNTALNKLQRLSELEIHSIEQPIKPRNWDDMTKLCEQSPLAIALDEELIGVFHKAEKERLLESIKPQYIILKPSLIGGYAQSEEWIDLAEKNSIGWWVTSALESNIGLNAIAQWTYKLNSKLPQGLGTGSLYTNNFDSPLVVEGGNLYYINSLSWQADLIQQLCT